MKIVLLILLLNLKLFKYFFLILIFHQFKNDFNNVFILLKLKKYQLYDIINIFYLVIINSPHLHCVVSKSNISRKYLNS